MLRYLLLFGLPIMVVDVSAQSVLRIGTLPQVNLSMPLNDVWRINARIESRQIWVQDAGDTKVLFDYERTDLAAIVTRRVGSRSTAGAGYLLRIAPDGNAHRFVQQFSFRSGFGRVLPLSHRISSDQTIRHSTSAEMRLRYRVMAEIPLMGQTLDPGEFYLKAGNEYIGALNGNKADLETRILIAAGLMASTEHLLETGIDYRYSAIFGGTATHGVWFCISAFLGL